MGKKVTVEPVVESKAGKLRALYEQLRPGGIESHFGGTIKEVEGSRALVDFQTASVPLTEDGLPRATELTNERFQSQRGRKIMKNEIGKSMLLGTYVFPVVVGGEIREIQGILMAISRPQPKFLFNTGVKVSWVDEVTEKEEVRFRPILKIPRGTELFATEIAKEQDLTALMGSIIAHQMGIEIV